MEIKRVGEIMIPIDAYPHIPYWFTLRQALIVFSKAKLEINNTFSLPRAILIFDKEYKFLGMVRRRDILRELDIGAPVKDSDKIKDESFFLELAENLKEKAKEQIQKVLRPINETVDYEEYVTEAIYKMVDDEISLLPVIKDGRVVGVVRTVEMLEEVSNLVIEESIRNQNF